ncbi:hypothetical protein ACSBR2_025010 [Camellia fascicularis]
MGQWTATKPSRSDEVLDAVEQNRIANLVRAQFDSIAPKRPTKPNRSESDSLPPPPTPPPCQNIPLPEFQKFQSLQSQAIFSGSFTSQTSLWRPNTTNNWIQLTNNTTRLEVGL